MKKRNYFMFALAAMLFAACSNDDGITDGDGGTIDPKGESWVALTIKATTPSSKALHDPNQENATDAEKEIKSLRAIFFSAAADPVVVKDMTMTASEAGNPGQPEGGVSKAFKVPNTSKRILIVANPPAGWDADWAGKTFSQVNAAIDEDVANLISTEKGFMMSNAKGGLEPSDNDGEGIDLTLHKTESEATQSPTAIHIDRVVAKVRVFAGGASIDGEKANVYDPEWVLNVTNKKYYPVSKRIKTYKDTATPFDQYKLGSYRIDPNYDDTNFNDWDWDGSTYNVHYNYFDPSSPSITWQATNVDGSTSDKVEYCLENTQVELYSTHAYTTQVLLKANFAPKGLAVAAGGTYDVAQDEDWLIVNGVSYTYTTLLGFLKKELTAKYMDRDPDGFNTPLVNAVNSYLDFIGAGSVTLPSSAQLDETAATAKAEELRVEFDGKKTNVSGAGANTDGNFSYYEAGISYYKIMIKHDDTADVMNGLGEFGVVRNSVYDIHISKFNNPGYPVIPKPDPDTPDETDDQWLSIKINVNPWTWYSQTVEL